MGKLKTHKGTASRVKITGTGKVQYNTMRMGHLKIKLKSQRRLRMKRSNVLSNTQTKKIRRAMPGLSV